MSDKSIEFPAIFTAVPWPGSGPRAGVWFDVFHPYMEAAYLPIIGPSATVCMRRFAHWFAASPLGVTVELAELGPGLGIGSGHQMQRTLNRLVMFGLAKWTGSRLQVRGTVPALSERHLSRLHPSLRALHETFVNSQRTVSST